jgi:hypothetical protein
MNNQSNSGGEKDIHTFEVSERTHVEIRGMTEVLSFD